MKIVVTKPGTDFLVAYRKRFDSPTLKLTRSWSSLTSLPLRSVSTSPAISEFRAHAFHAAVSKARELGWMRRLRSARPFYRGDHPPAGVAGSPELTQAPLYMLGLGRVASK